MSPDYADLPPVPILGDDTPADDDVDAVAAALLDEEPTARQKEMVGGGAYLMPPSDRSDAGGVPVGQSPDDLAGTKVAIVSKVSLDEGSPAFGFTLDGKNDKILRETFAKYALQAQDASPKDRLALMEAAFVEAAARKGAVVKAAAAERKVAHAAAQQAKGAAVPKPEHRPAGGPATPHPQVEVVFDFGPELGQMAARYTHAFIHGANLVLVAGEGDRAGGVYLPPVLGGSRSIAVTLPGLAAPVRVYSVGQVFPHNGELLCVLLVDRSAE